jgi:hypothetical protein
MWSRRSIACRVVIAAPRAELHDALGTDSQDLKLLPDDALRHLPADVFHQQTYTTVLWERESVKSHTLAPIKGSEGIDCGSETVGRPGTNINFSPFIWADRRLGHKVLNHARKPRVSVNPVTKMGVLWGSSPAGTAPA